MHVHGWGGCCAQTPRTSHLLSTTSYLRLWIPSSTPPIQDRPGQREQAFDVSSDASVSCRTSTTPSLHLCPETQCNLANAIPGSWGAHRAIAPQIRKSNLISGTCVSLAEFLILIRSMELEERCNSTQSAQSPRPKGSMTIHIDKTRDTLRSLIGPKCVIHLVFIGGKNASA